jgi:hypothetical protein
MECGGLPPLLRLNALRACRLRKHGVVGAQHAAPDRGKMYALSVLWQPRLLQFAEKRKPRHSERSLRSEESLFSLAFWRREISRRTRALRASPFGYGVRRLAAAFAHSTVVAANCLP